MMSEDWEKARKEEEMDAEEDGRDKVRTVLAAVLFRDLVVVVVVVVDIVAVMTVQSSSTDEQQHSWSTHSSGSSSERLVMVDGVDGGGGRGRRSGWRLPSQQKVSFYLFCCGCFCYLITRLSFSLSPFKLTQKW